MQREQNWKEINQVVNHGEGGGTSGQVFSFLQMFFSMIICIFITKRNEN